MNKIDKDILEAVMKMTNQRRDVKITKDELFVYMYLSMKRNGLKPYSFETIARRLRILVRKGYFTVKYVEEKKGNLKWRRAYYIPRRLTIAAKLKAEQLRSATLTVYGVKVGASSNSSER
ncbi:hypothetical wHTH DNA-binding protein [Alphaspiravirus yamagawaense]|uniref:Hypothetical wHTH DNA-binding protein n=1 Tax=Alphaspiravirus yamagawaense TaxID=1157339 RepID=J7Q7K8_9VIRU|nr:hypothetical wHTH DNA-binding protein [Aeropyrum coil-shaped virus]CCG27867.1 hypothetical wHTH DNA-binding protein [Aeropyrum coil-shaped virus]